MIRLTRETDYAILILSRFAKEEIPVIHSAREIAEITGITLPMVYKILKTLVASGFLVSHRGIRGGYALSKKPGEISVGDIIAALEGPICLTECSSGDNACSLEENCCVQEQWMTINSAVQGVLSQMPLSAMCKPLPEQLFTLNQETS